MSGKGDKERTKKYRQYRDNFDLIRWNGSVEANSVNVLSDNKKIRKKVYGRGSG